MPESCAVVLKEWSATVAALQQGRQVLLLRKGGLLDPEGAFDLEYANFWLAPTRFHQNQCLLKPQHRDLIEAGPESSRVLLALSSWARVEQSWSISFAESALLARLPHIWSQSWLDTRFDYQPERPLLVVAVRVFVSKEPQLVERLPEYSGCRSWIELTAPLPVQNALAAVDEAEWNRQLTEIQCVLGA